MPRGIYKRTKPLTAETKKKISQTLKGRIKTQEHLANISKALKGRKLSKEHRKKLRIAHLGHVHSEEHKKKIGRSGSKNASWKGGRYTSKGRVMIMVKTHPYSRRGYVRRSRLTMEKMLGRYLKPCEIVHHKGIKYPFGSTENKQDDRPQNLQLFPNQAAHAKFHYYAIDSKTRVDKGGRLYSLH